MASRGAPAAATATGGTPPASGAKRAATAAGSAFSGAKSTSGSVVDNGAGAILAVLVWGWVLLPLLQGGPSQVKDVIRAKFLNKASDGSWLP